MAKLIISDTEKKNMRWDAKRKTYVDWRVEVYVSQGIGKKPVRHRVTFPSETEAKSAENRLRVKSENIRLGIETARSASRIKVKDVFDKYREPILKTGPRHAKTLTNRVFTDFLECNPGLQFVDELKKAHFDKYILLREKQVKSRTVDREMTPIISALRNTIREFPELDDYRLPNFERPRYKKKPRQTNVSESEKDLICQNILTHRLKFERKLRTKSRVVVAQMFELAWFLGLRLGECRKLLKTDFNPAKKTLRVIRWKTGAITIFEFLPERVMEILGAAGGSSPSEFIFNLTCSIHTLNLIIKDACEASGLRHGIKELDGITFHSNRHSFTSRMIAVTDIPTTQSFTGHSNAEMVAYYAHATPASRKGAMQKMYGENDKLDIMKLTEIYKNVIEKKMDLGEFLRKFEAYI